MNKKKNQWGLRSRKHLLFTRTILSPACLQSRLIENITDGLCLIWKLTNQFYQEDLRNKQEKEYVNVCLYESVFFCESVFFYVCKCTSLYVLVCVCVCWKVNAEV